MGDPSVESGGEEPGTDLHQAAGVAGRKDGGTRVRWSAPLR